VPSSAPACAGAPPEEKIMDNHRKEGTKGGDVRGIVQEKKLTGKLVPDVAEAQG